MPFTFISCPPNANTRNEHHGDHRSNRLVGSDCSDVVHGHGGSDFISGRGGNDEIHGGDGIDVINGGRGNDRIFGGTDGDFLSGDSGDDELHGEDGDDVIRDLSGRNSVFGGAGDDLIEASGLIAGGHGNDLIAGHPFKPGNTYLFGRGDGNDVIRPQRRSSRAPQAGGWLDTLAMGAGIVPAMVALRSEGDHLVLSVDTADTVTLADWFVSPGHQLGEIRFDNGARLDANGINAGLAAGMASADALLDRMAQMTQMAPRRAACASSGQPAPSSYQCQISRDGLMATPS